MFKLKTDLKPGNAVAKGFPLIANKQQGANSFDWNIVLGHFVKYCYRMNVDNKSLLEFENECEKLFRIKLDEPRFWEDIKSMYFLGDNLYRISPELLIFKLNEGKSKSADSRLGKFFLNLLQDFYIKEKPKTKLNFIERDIVDTFDKSLLQKGAAGSFTEIASERTALPFLSELFARDLQFLNSKPKYFINFATDFLKLYAFLYTAQLAINLGAWKQGKPKSMKCFFIIDNERASHERTWVKDFGYKQFEKAIQKVFPYLSMSESLQESSSTRFPLWELAEQLDESHLSALNKYTQNFIEHRKFEIEAPVEADPLMALENLLQLSEKQFQKGETRHGVNTDYVKTIENEFSSHFVQNRGRAGRVLVFNQDYILLLTNLAIGKVREQLRFHELMMEFEKRGVYFDKQSQKVLVDFYERIGNVDRMSDSGDAVYVRKTV